MQLLNDLNVLVVGGTRAGRLRAADHLTSHSRSPAGTRRRFIRLDDIHRAFPNHQAGGTRLVLTQSTYVMQVLLDSLGPEDRVLATSDRRALRHNAPEACEGRGPWRFFETRHPEPTESATEVAADGSDADDDTAFLLISELSPDPPSGVRVMKLLSRAYHSASVATRLALCHEAVGIAPDCSFAWLAFASVARETNDMSKAREALDRAVTLSPNWAAAHYENGKFWLGYDELARARDAFARAGELMPTFSAAFSNLGATLGELDEPAAALAAFNQALAHDPTGFTILNNIGVVTREVGQLGESEAALRRVIELSPRFVFGYYNLGHTLFLAGKYPEAVAQYEEGQRRDPEKNRRQACRLAMTRLATGDVSGAERDFWTHANTATPEEREDLLLEAYEIGRALLASHAELAAAQPFVERIGQEIV